MNLRFRAVGTSSPALFGGLVLASALASLPSLGACGSFGSAPGPTDDAAVVPTKDASADDARAEAPLDASPSDDSSVLPDGAVACSTALATVDDKFSPGISLFEPVAAIGGPGGDTLYLAGRAPCGPAGSADRLGLYSVNLAGIPSMLSCFGDAGERITSIDADSTGIVVGSNVPAGTGSTTGRIRRLNLNATERGTAVPIGFADRSVSVTSVRRLNGADVWAYTSSGANDSRGYLATVDGGRLLDLGARAVPAIATAGASVATVDVAAAVDGPSVNVKRYSPLPDGSLAPDGSFGTNGTQTLTVQAVGVSGLNNASFAMRGSIIALGFAPGGGGAVQLLEGGKPPRSIGIVGASGRTSVVFDCDGTVLAAYGSTTSRVVRIDPRSSVNTPVPMFEVTSDHASVALLRSAGGETFWVRSYDKGTDVVRLQRKVL